MTDVEIKTQRNIKDDLDNWKKFKYITEQKRMVMNVEFGSTVTTTTTTTGNS